MGILDKDDSGDSKVSDSSSSSKSDGQSLSSSIWDGMKNAAKSAVGKAESLNSDSSSSLKSVDLSTGSLYGGDGGGTKGGGAPADAPTKPEGVKGGDAPADVGAATKASDISFWKHPVDKLSAEWKEHFGDKPAEQPKAPETPADKSMAVPGAEYKGEDIKKGVGPDNHYTFDNKGETLEDVAKHKLGKDATPEDVQKYVTEIKQINHITDPSKLENQMTEIKLPGHNKDGSLILEEADGGKRTISHDGAVKYENKDGFGYEMKPQPDGGHSYHHFGKNPEDNYDYTRTPDGKGGYSEKHTGTRPDDNYEITKTADGHYKIADKAGDTPIDKTTFDDAHPDSAVERAKLMDVEQKITDPERRMKFNNDLESFEQRARQQNLSPEERAKFYHEVSTLMDAKDNPKKPDLPKEDERIKIAEQVMDHGAHPGAVDQGNHSTCGAASLEARMFTKNPAEAAHLITEVATTGVFHAKDGTMVTPDASVIKPDREGAKDPPPDGQRDYASHIFQGTAVSMTDSGHGYHIVNPAGPDDNGERYRDMSRNPLFGEVKKFDGVTPAEVLQMERKITGADSPLPIIENGKVDAGDGNRHVNSEKELKDQLDELKKDGKLPAVIFVHTGNEPFWSDSHGGSAGGSGGYHFVTITDYDSKAGKVSIDNQWGKDADHAGISTKELFDATRAPTKDVIKDLQKEVAQNNRAGHPDASIELELLRLQLQENMIHNDQYQKGIEKVMIAANKRWDKKGAQDDEDLRTNNEYYEMLKKLSDEDREKVQGHIDKRH